MRRADIEVPNLAVDVDSWARSACYPQGSFYPLGDSASTSYCRITSADFRLCSTGVSHSQAPFCAYTPRMSSDHPEGTFARLRYVLGGDRPSQTPHLIRSVLPIRDDVSTPTCTGWYSKGASTETGVPASQAPTYPLQPMPVCHTRLE